MHRVLDLTKVGNVEAASIMNLRPKERKMHEARWVQKYRKLFPVLPSVQIEALEFQCLDDSWMDIVINPGKYCSGPLH